MWKKSKYSAANGQCVEAMAEFRSARCENGGCVELAPGTERKSSYSRLGRCVTAVSCTCECTHTLVRDSKLGDKSPILEFTTAEFGTFLKQIKQGKYDLY